MVDEVSWFVIISVDPYRFEDITQLCFTWYIRPKKKLVCFRFPTDPAHSHATQ